MLPRFVEHAVLFPDAERTSNSRNCRMRKPHLAAALARACSALSEAALDLICAHAVPWNCHCAGIQTRAASMSRSKRRAICGAHCEIARIDDAVLVCWARMSGSFPRVSTLGLTTEVLNPR
jgi:hypothetical protein